MKGDFFAEFLIEYWYIFLPLLSYYYMGLITTKKKFNEEQILLENMGFNRIVKKLYL